MTLFLYIIELIGYKITLTNMKTHLERRISMKKGINIWSFKDDTPLDQCMGLAKEAGYDGIELALSQKGDLNLKSSEGEILKIKRMAECIGLELPSLASGLYWSYSLTSNNKDIRIKAKDIVKKQLETAALLGADTILVVPGAVGVDFIRDCEIVSYDRAYEYSLEAFSELKDYAQKLKISIALENVWNKFLLSPLETRDFIDKIGSTYVGSYLDVGNLIYTGYPEQWIRILGRRIKKVHFKDFRRSVGNLSGFVDLLEGDVNFPEVMKAFCEVGYDDYCIGELSCYKYSSNQIVFNGASSMDAIIKNK